MDNRLKLDYFTRTGKVIAAVHKDCDPTSPRILATIAANFASYGYVMEPALAQIISLIGDKEAVTFYKDTIPLLKNSIGADREDASVFYPNFPEEVMEMSEADMFVNEILYYMTGMTPSVYESASESFPFIGKKAEHTLTLGSEKDYVDMINKTMRSAASYSLSDFKAILDFMNFYDGKGKRIPEKDELTNKENTVMLLIMAKDVRQKTISKYLTTPTDILRYTAALHSVKEFVKSCSYNVVESRLRNDDPLSSMNNNNLMDLKSAVALKREDITRLNISKPEQHMVMDLLSSTGKSENSIAEDMLRHRNIWKQWIKRIHPFKAEKYTEDKYFNVMAAMKDIVENRHVDRYSSRMEAAIDTKDFTSIIHEGLMKPGDMLDRADKILRDAVKYGTKEDIDNIINAIGKCASKSSVTVDLRLLGQIEKRTEEETSRVFMSKGTTVEVKDKNRDPLPEDICKRVAESCKSGLAEIFKGKPDMGKVYVSKDYENFKVPTDLRDANESTRTFTHGSTFNSEIATNIKRLFISWTNLGEDSRADHGYDCKGRVDNDLSCTLYDKDYKFIGTCGWNSKLKLGNNSVIFSGDITDGGPRSGKGAAEFIDFDAEKLKKSGVRYVVPGVYSFTEQPFSKQNAYFGYMSRELKDMGENFEPSSVETKFSLTSNSTSEIPIAFDIEKNNVIWIDRSVASLDQFVSALQDKKRIGSILNEAVNSKAASMADLIDANVKANGEYTDNPKEADILFMTEKEKKAYIASITDEEKDALLNQKFVMPYEIYKFTGDLMKEGHEEQKKDKNIEKAETKDVGTKDAEAKDNNGTRPSSISNFVSYWDDDVIK